MNIFWILFLITMCLFRASTVYTEYDPGRTLIEIEAEQFVRSGNWTVEKLEDCSGRGVLSNTETSAITAEIEFKKPGTYYLWIRERRRMRGSIYQMTLDGNTLTNANQFSSEYPGKLVWARRAIMENVTAGRHTLSIINMEQKLIVFDQFILTDDETFVPSGTVETPMTKSGSARSKLQPLFSDEEYSLIPQPAAYDFSRKNTNNIERIPFNRGRGLWGLNILDCTLKQAAYEAPILARQGINHVKLSPVLPPKGLPYYISVETEQDPNFEQSLEASRLWGKSGITVNWMIWINKNSYLTVVDQEARKKLGITAADYSDLFDYIDIEGKKKSWEHMLGPGRYGVNIFHPKGLKLYQAYCKEWARQAARAGNVIGLTIPSGENSLTGYGPYDKYSRVAWQEFLKRIFQDDNPGKDTNADGATYNWAYHYNYGDWSEVDRPSSSDFSNNPRLIVLNNIWKIDGQMRFIRAGARAAKEENSFLDICPTLQSETWESNRSGDISLFASAPEISLINTGCYAEHIAFAYPFGKSCIESEATIYGIDDYESAKNKVIKTLPYNQGYEWWPYLSRQDMSPMDGWYSATWIAESIGGRDEKSAPQKVVRYDSKFEIFPQFAPFIGKIFARPREDVLWINSFIYDKKPMGLDEVINPYYYLYNTHAVSDVLMLLNPDAIDLERYKLVIYRNPGAAGLSVDTYDRLRQYVNQGGTVVTSAYQIAANPTLAGADNRRMWWKDLQSEREFEADKTLFTYYDDFKTSKWLKDVISKAGDFKASRPWIFLENNQGTLTYKFEIPAETRYIRIYDIDSPWGPGSFVKLSSSYDGKKWEPRYHHKGAYEHVEYNELINIEKLAEKPKSFYLRFVIKATKQSHASLRELKVDFMQEKPLSTAGVTTVDYLGETYTYDELYPYLRPKNDSIITDGQISDSADATYPLVMVKKEGRGKWILLNLPPIFDGIREEAITLDFWRNHFGLLSSIVKKHTGIDLPDYFTVWVNKGQNFITAWKPSLLEYKSARIKVEEDREKVVVFEIFDKQIIGGKPYLEPHAGSLAFTADFGNTSSHLWVVKQYGQPVVLYTDGTIKNMAGIDDGVFDGKRLTFQFAERAYISSPTRPAAAYADGKQAAFSYDPITHLLTIEREGTLSDASIIFH